MRVQLTSFLLALTSAVFAQPTQTPPITQFSDLRIGMSQDAVIQGLQNCCKLVNTVTGAFAYSVSDKNSGAPLGNIQFKNNALFSVDKAMEDVSSLSSPEFLSLLINKFSANCHGVFPNYGTFASIKSTAPILFPHPKNDVAGTIILNCEGAVTYILSIGTFPGDPNQPVGNPLRNGTVNITESWFKTN